MSQKARVIALVDMDCFYCQVEEKLNPNLQGKPVAVVQYNLWREGGIIAANYLAKDKGVTKGMWMHEAKELCPEIEFARVAELRGRADLTKYRDAGKQVADVLCSFTDFVERASVDEAYLDLTSAVETELLKGKSNISLEYLRTTHVVGCQTSDFISNISCNLDTDGFCDDDFKLAIGGIIVEKIRAAILEKTGYICSAGIAHNKILAKLICGLHKPNKQTILPQHSVTQYFLDLPVKKIKRLGGKFGKKVAEELNIQFIGELLKFSEKELVKKFDSKTGHWLFNIARGIDNEPVCPKLISKSISCCKRFPGKNALFKQKDVEHWMNELGLEIAERLEKDQEENGRKARMMTISFTQDVNKSDVSNSKTCPLKSYDAKKIAFDALKVINKSCRKSDGSFYVKFLGISVGSFEDMKNTKHLKYFFEKNAPAVLKVKSDSQTINDSIQQVNIENLSQLKSEEKYLDNSVKSNENNGHKQSILLKIAEDEIKLNSSSLENQSEHTITDEFQDQNSHDIFEEKDPCHELGIAPNQSNINKSTNIENSFFAQYFEKSIYNHEGTSSSNPLNCSEEMPEIQTEDGSSQIFYAENFEKCDECGQNIELTDICSHRDYHYALKLQKEDAIVQKQSPNADKIVEHKVNTSSKKRKANNAGNIEVFLKKVSSESTEFTEICVECNKSIKLTDIETHSDYHAAKRLNKELNFGNSSFDVNIKKKNKVIGNDIVRYLKSKNS